MNATNDVGAPKEPAGALEALSIGLHDLRHALASSLSAVSLHLAVARRRIESAGGLAPALGPLDQAEDGVASAGRLLDVLSALAVTCASPWSAFSLGEAVAEAASASPGVGVHLEAGPRTLRGPRDALVKGLAEMTRLGGPSASWSVCGAAATLTFEKGKALRADRQAPRADRLFALDSFPGSAELFLAAAALRVAGGRLEASTVDGTTRLRISFGEAA